MDLYYVMPDANHVDENIKQETIYYTNIKSKLFSV